MGEVVSLIKMKCPDCSWSYFQDGETVWMTPCYHCNSTGYIYTDFVSFDDSCGEVTNG